LVKDPASTTVVSKPVDLITHETAVHDRLVRDELPGQIWVVSFCNQRPDDSDGDGYGETAGVMDELARAQPGYVGIDSVRTDDGVGITVSRWSSIAAMVSWRKVSAHAAAQQAGRDRFYDWYRSDVARVDRTSEFRRS
jgi:heme-degrading monooxygenase HmoA